MELQTDDASSKDSLRGRAQESRVQSPLRMQYAAETKIFRAQFGGLEEIRQKLGFSRRKMCQLLLVDPSAWTRWTKDEAKVPPHIFRSLEWYLALSQKVLTQPDLSEVFNRRYRLTREMESEDHSLRLEVAQLKQDLRRQRQVSTWLTAAVMVLALTAIFFLYS